MEKLKEYLRLKEYSDAWVRVYTYNKLGRKVFLFGNKAKVLNLTLGFTFLDCDVLNVNVEFDGIDIIINYRGGEK